MSRSSHWDTTVSCPRWVKTVNTKKFETEDIILPNGITEEEMLKLPEHIGETYEECSGEVRMVGYYDPGQLSGPPEGENELYPCDSCKAENWSDKEKKDMEDHHD